MHNALSRAGKDDVAGITSLSERCIENLKYMDGTTKPPFFLTDLPDDYQQRLICFNAYIQMKLSKGISVNEDWQNHVTKEEFQEFRVTGYDPDIATSVPIPFVGIR